jgi:hypothetical protein
MKSNKFLFISILLIGNLLLSACIIPFVGVTRGSGNVISESREVSDFEKIILNGMGNITLTQGETESLKIEAEDNILSEIESDVSGSTLTLGFTESSWRKNIIPTEPVNYTLTVKDLSAITVNGAFYLKMEELETSEFKLTINGAGSFDFGAINGDQFKVQLNGSANVATAGEVTEQIITFDGAGTYDGGDLETSITEVSFNGLGNATVWVKDTLDITINGGGNLDYYGSPSVVQDINGAGEINNLGDK